MSSLTESFVSEVERRILTGQWEIGKKLPPCRDLAEEFHVSRSVINAGIVQLTAKGYLKTVPRQYICVSNWRETGNFDLISSLIDNDLQHLICRSDLLEGRMALETAIAEKAATCRTREDLDRLRKIVEEESRRDTVEHRSGLDQDFHHAVTVASHNMVYVAMMNSFRPVAWKLTREFYERGIAWDFVLQTHRNILEAIERGDSAMARRQMQALLAHGETVLTKQGG